MWDYITESSLAYSILSSSNSLSPFIVIEKRNRNKKIVEIAFFQLM